MHILTDRDGVDVYSTFYVADMADTDNALGAIAACRRELGLNLAGVVVTGRHTKQESMQRILHWNTARMRGILDEFGFGHIPVLTGEIPPATIVSDEAHVREWIDLDPHGYHKTKKPNGNFAAATQLARKLAKKGKINLIGAGPLGEIDRWLQDPQIIKSINLVTCQYGRMGFGNATTMGGGLLGFNGACNPLGTRSVMMNPLVDIYISTSDTTKDSRVGFKHPSQMAKLGVDPGMVDMTTKFWELAQKPRGEDSFPHDLHPVFSMAQLLGKKQFDMFTFQEVVIDRIGSRGELHARLGAAPGDRGKRYVVTNVNAGKFMSQLGRLCRKS